MLLQWPQGVINLLGLGALGRANARVCVVCGLPITESTFRYSQAGCYHERCVPPHVPVPPCKVSIDVFCLFFSDHVAGIPTA